MKAVVHLGSPHPKERIAMIRGYCVRVTYRGLGADEQIEWTRRLSEVIARSLIRLR
ncbi:MAG TPA: hypothetical protein VFA51_12325 [Candidatus Udaeobacter sp.]|nr:hypothetical protein [Candidatus Udaeobacter sp.]